MNKFKTILVSIFLLIALFCFNGCSTEISSLPASSGKTGELLFIIDKNQWDGLAGDSIRQTFGSEYLGLGQPEPMFNLAHIEERAFTKMFQSHRNIFIVEIKPEQQTPLYEVRKNVWAQPQIVVKIAAATSNEFLEELSARHAQIIRLFFENERERMLRAFKREEDINITNTLKKDYGLSLTIPKGYFIAKQTKDFCWIRRETDETSIGLIIHLKDYSDAGSFNFEQIIDNRNSITKAHIPGPREGSYMQVSQKVVQPFSKEINFKGMYAVETRGLWDLHGDFMGGPFINYTFVDENTNKLITLDAFVYAPRFNKRDYVIQAEALIYSLEL